MSERQEIEAGAQRGTADVIIPTYRPGEKFLKLADALARRSGMINRLIIINTEESCMSEAVRNKLRELDESEDSPLCGRIELTHIKKDEFDHAGTRRLGVSMSQAEFFICMTDDAVPANGELIERILAPLRENADIAMSYARQLPAEDCGIIESYTRGFNYPAESMIKTAKDMDRLGIKTYFASNVCCAYRRSIYDKLGGFVESAGFNEDMLYAAKAIKNGYAVSYTADALVIHSHNYSISKEFHRNFDLGLSQAEHPEVFAGIKSEGEGIKLVRDTAAYLVRSGHPLMLVTLFFKSTAKYAGYRLGKGGSSLPGIFLTAFAMNKEYVKKHYARRK